MSDKLTIDEAATNILQELLLRGKLEHKHITYILRDLQPTPSIGIDEAVEEMCHELCEIPPSRWRVEDEEGGDSPKPPCFFGYEKEDDTDEMFRGCRGCREWVTEILTRLQPDTTAAVKAALERVRGEIDTKAEELPDARRFIDQAITALEGKGKK